MKYITEHKFWGKSIIDFLNWFFKIDKYFAIIDTETTGLPSDPYDIQLTQISCIITIYDKITNTFKEIDTFNKKVKLTKNTLDILSNHKNRIRRVLSFNRYGGKGKYYNEEESLKDFYEFIDKYNNPILVIQNASFDMRFLNTRNINVNFSNLNYPYY